MRQYHRRHLEYIGMLPVVMPGEHQAMPSSPYALERRLLNGLIHVVSIGPEIVRACPVQVQWFIHKKGWMLALHAFNSHRMYD